MMELHDVSKDAVHVSCSCAVPTKIPDRAKHPRLRAQVCARLLKITAGVKPADIESPPYLSLAISYTCLHPDAQRVQSRVFIFSD
jgi:hypothetical protein